jgi:hypothetical protein
VKSRKEDPLLVPRPRANHVKSRWPPRNPNPPRFFRLQSQPNNACKPLAKLADARDHYLAKRIIVEGAGGEAGDSRPEKAGPPARVTPVKHKRPRESAIRSFEFVIRLRASCLRLFLLLLSLASFFSLSLSLPLFFSFFFFSFFFRRHKTVGVRLLKLYSSLSLSLYWAHFLLPLGIIVALGHTASAPITMYDFSAFWIERPYVYLHVQINLDNNLYL